LYREKTPQGEDWVYLARTRRRETLLPRLRAALATALVALLTSCASAGAPQSNDAEKRLKNRSVYWTPPLVDAQLKSRISTPACDLADALAKAGARSNELVTNLQTFTSRETIEFKEFDSLGLVKDSGSGSFDYIVALQTSASGVSVQDARNPAHGSRLPGAVTQDVGLPAMALIFLPEMQPDYEMSCEATVERYKQTLWVIRFQQRPDKAGRTLSLRGDNGVSRAARVKGRAWISPGSGELVHLETALLEPVPAAHVRHWFLSLDYAPVQFQSKNVKLWLPEAVDTYCEFEDHRTIVYHVFTNFLLSSVETEQTDQKPE
jgi:hypothetical protein